MKQIDEIKQIIKNNSHFNQYTKRRWITVEDDQLIKDLENVHK